MSYYHSWVRSHREKIDFQNVCLPSDITYSKMDSVEIKEWTLDTEDYYNYFPVYKRRCKGETRAYYINIDINSFDFHKLSRLRILSDGQYTLQLDIIPWEEISYKYPGLYRKITC